MKPCNQCCEEIADGVLMCKHCKALQDSIPCIQCRELIDKGAEACDKCNAKQDKSRFCEICASAIPKAAVRCNTCGNYKNKWRRRFNVTQSMLPILTALFAVLSTMITSSALLIHRNSNTSITFTSATPDTIYVHVSNSGQSISTLRGYRLKFGDIPIENVELELADDDKRLAANVIGAMSQARLGLIVHGLTRRPGAAFDPDTAPSDKKITLEIDVDESNRSVTRHDFIRYSDVHDLVKNKL